MGPLRLQGTSHTFTASTTRRTASLPSLAAVVAAARAAACSSASVVLGDARSVTSTGTVLAVRYRLGKRNASWHGVAVVVVAPALPPAPSAWDAGCSCDGEMVRKQPRLRAVGAGDTLTWSVKASTGKAESTTDLP